MLQESKASSGLQIALIVGALILVAIVTCFVWLRNNRPVDNGSATTQTDNQTPATTAPVDNNATPTDSSDVKVDSPKSGQVITSPVTITGQAKGSWFFEAVFPIKILDASGTVIGQGTARAQSDWMTSDFVPFTATVSFTTPSLATGKIVLANDNPSGLAANAKSATIAIKF